MAKKPKAATPAVKQIEAAEHAAEVAIAAAKTKHNKSLAITGDIKPEAALTWFVSTNPRSKGRGTYDRFEKYIGADTVAAYMAAGGTLGDLRWDLRSGYLAIEGVELGGEVATRVVKEKVAKAPRAKKVKTEEEVAAESELDAVTAEETID